MAGSGTLKAVSRLLGKKKDSKNKAQKPLPPTWNPNQNPSGSYVVEIAQAELDKTRMEELLKINREMSEELHRAQDLIFSLESSRDGLTEANMKLQNEFTTAQDQLAACQDHIASLQDEILSVKRDHASFEPKSGQTNDNQEPFGNDSNLGSGDASSGGHRKATDEMEPKDVRSDSGLLHDTGRVSEYSQTEPLTPRQHFSAEVASIGVETDREDVAPKDDKIFGESARNISPVFVDEGSQIAFEDTVPSLPVRLPAVVDNILSWEDGGESELHFSYADFERFRDTIDVEMERLQDIFDDQKGGDASPSEMDPLSVLRATLMQLEDSCELMWEHKKKTDASIHEAQADLMAWKAEYHKATMAVEARRSFLSNPFAEPDDVEMAPMSPNHFVVEELESLRQQVENGHHDRDQMADEIEKLRVDKAVLKRELVAARSRISGLVADLRESKEEVDTLLQKLREVGDRPSHPSTARSKSANRPSELCLSDVEPSFIDEDKVDDFVFRTEKATLPSAAAELKAMWARNAQLAEENAKLLRVLKLEGLSIPTEVILSGPPTPQAQSPQHIIDASLGSPILPYPNSEAPPAFRPSVSASRAEAAETADDVITCDDPVSHDVIPADSASLNDMASHCAAQAEGVVSETSEAETDMLRKLSIPEFPPTEVSVCDLSHFSEREREAEFKSRSRMARKKYIEKKKLEEEERKAMELRSNHIKRRPDRERQARMESLYKLANVFRKRKERNAEKHFSQYYGKNVKLDRETQERSVQRLLRRVSTGKLHLKRQIVQDEMKENTFQPETNESLRAPADKGKITAAQQQATVERLTGQALLLKERRLHAIRQCVDMERGRELTFKPSVNSASVPSGKVTATRVDECVRRLSKRSYWTTNLAKKRIEEEEKRVLTFHPNLQDNQKPPVLTPRTRSDVVTRLAKKDTTAKDEATQRVKEMESEVYTFHPEISKSYEVEDSRPQQKKMDILATKDTLAIEKAREKWETLEDAQLTFRPAISGNSLGLLASRGKLSAADEVVDRLLRAEQDRQRAIEMKKRERDEEELRHLQEKPKLNPQSVVLAAAALQKMGLQEKDAVSRMHIESEESEIRKYALEMQHDTRRRTECPFQPSITTKSKYLAKNHHFDPTQATQACRVLPERSWGPDSDTPRIPLHRPSVKVSKSLPTVSSPRDTVDTPGSARHVRGVRGKRTSGVALGVRGGARAETPVKTASPGPKGAKQSSTSDAASNGSKEAVGRKAPVVRGGRPTSNGPSKASDRSASEKSSDGHTGAVPASPLRQD